MNRMPPSPTALPMLADCYAEQMELAKATARRLRREAVRDCGYGAASLARSTRRLQAALQRHLTLRSGALVRTPT